MYTFAAGCNTCFSSAELSLRCGGQITETFVPASQKAFAMWMILLQVSRVSTPANISMCLGRSGISILKLGRQGGAELFNCTYCGQRLNAR
jgi:hypothetical protein